MLKKTKVKRFTIFNLIRNVGGFYIVMYGILFTVYNLLFTRQAQEQLAQILFEDSLNPKQAKDTDPPFIKKRIDECNSLNLIA